MNLYATLALLCTFDTRHDYSREKGCGMVLHCVLLASRSNDGGKEDGAGGEK